ncbi:Sporulation initiation inhibitor protein Soj [Vibrio thalassae]|uniref:Sporulation initiation inhibitor protein Soj n=1 Tax=Vibrio thalassae TaxID=1243014 RepID=A0A240EGB2_9VIBR|nr:ParA family protein [Vibrio thalassae]SNX47219.1 Sporulation initiation inhibitor protein Soj [Vibrio thalassae]
MVRSKQGNIDFLRQQYDKVKSLKSKRKVAKGILRMPNFNAKQIEQLLGETELATKAGIAMCEKSRGIDFPRKGNNAYNLNREEALEVARFMGYKPMREIRPDNYEMPVLAVHDAKGGIGKSTTCETLSIQGTFDIKRAPRILLADTDSQGSQRHKLAPNYTTPKHSLFALLKDEVEVPRDVRLSPQKQAAYRAALKEIIVSTYAEDIDLLPSFPECKNINVFFSGALARGVGIEQVISVYKDVVISPLKHDYDVVILDTNPATDMTLYCLYYAATSLIIPVTGRQQDINAYVEYLDSAAFIIETMMPHDWAGFTDIYTLITKNTKTNSGIFNRALQMIQLTRAFTTTIFEAKAYETASENNLPIQLIDHGSRNPASALESIRSLYNELAVSMYADIDKLYDEVED